MNGRDVMLLVSVFVNTNIAQINLAATAVQLLEVAVVGTGFESLALELDQIVGESEPTLASQPSPASAR